MLGVLVVPTALALYEAANQLQSIACAQGNTVVLPSARAGRLYWLAFGSKTDTGGPIQIVCTAGVPPPVKKFEPELADVPPDSTVKLLAPQFEGMNPSPAYTWYRDGKRIEGAAAGELILSGADANAPGRYSVQLDNGVGRELYDVVVLDTAHNTAGVQATLAGLREAYVAQPLIGLVAMMRDKAVAEVLDLLAEELDTIVITTMPEIDRSMTAAELSDLAGESFEANRIRSAPDPGHAIQMARGLAQQAGPQAVVLVIGSVYLAGQIKALLATAAGAGEDF